MVIQDVRTCNYNQTDNISMGNHLNHGIYERHLVKFVYYTFPDHKMLPLKTLIILSAFTILKFNRESTSISFQPCPLVLITTKTDYTVRFENGRATRFALCKSIFEINDLVSRGSILPVSLLPHVIFFKAIFSGRITR